MEWLATVTWDRGASVRFAPNTSSTSVDTLNIGAKFRISEIRSDSSDPFNGNKLWGKISENNIKHVGKYVALLYPGATGNERCKWEELTQTPPNAPILTHIIEVYSDGSLKVDGKFI